MASGQAEEQQMEVVYLKPGERPPEGHHIAVEVRETAEVPRVEAENSPLLVHPNQLEAIVGQLRGALKDTGQQKLYVVGPAGSRSA
jgi:hypothetical protein